MRNKKSKFLSEHMKKKPSDLKGLLRNVEILKCNEIESKILFENCLVEKRLKKLAELGPEIVLISLGKKGVATINGGVIKIFGLTKQVNGCSVGAGDTFFSSFLIFFEKTNKFDDAVENAIKYTINFLEGKNEK